MSRRFAGAAATLAALLSAGTLTPAVASIPAPGGAPAAVPAASSPSPSPDRARTDADQQVARHKSQLRAGSKDAFTARRTVLDRNGTGHVRYDRTYSGLPVLGGDMIVHVAGDGALRGFTQLLNRAIEVSTSPQVAQGTAQGTARAYATVHERVPSATTSRLVVDALSGRPVLAWDVLVTGQQVDQTPSRYHVLVDAVTGRTLRAYDEVMVGSGNSLYDGTVTFSTSKNASTGLFEMKDTTRGGNYTTDLKGATSGSGTRFTDADDVWGNGSTSDRATAGVDASYGAQMTFDYYKNVLGRNGIYNDGSGVRSRVHYGNNYNNAFWDGTQMTYGDGPSNAQPLVSLDVAGHEMSHGVTENTANLTYSGESGGLNEATSDIFGTMVEFYANNASDPGDYLIGEKLGTPFRYMDKPSRDGSSPDCWSSSVGGLDVHYSSGPGNHVFYLLAEGSGAKTINGVSYNSPTCNGSTVTGVGRDAAAKIWYRALSTYMTSSTNYAGARQAAVNAAKDLYGAGSSQCAAVESAFSAINVSGATCGSTPPPPPPGGTNLVANPGFESGASSWTTTSGVITNDATKAHSGSYLAWFDGYGSTHTDTASQSVTIPAASSATLTFWLQIGTNETGSTAYDTFKVQVVSGSTTTTLATYSNVNAGGYTQRTLNLSSYVGKSITLKFVGAEDSSLATSFLLDDISLTTG